MVQLIKKGGLRERRQLYNQIVIKPL